MLVPYCLLIAFSPLLLEHDLHLSLGMFYNCRLHADCIWWDGGVSTEGVLSRSKFMYFGEGEDVTYADVIKTRDGEYVARCEEVFSAC